MAVSAEAAAGDASQGRPVFHAIVEQVADAIVVVDEGGIIRYANVAAEELFRRPRDELVGDNFGFPLSPGERTEIDLVDPRERRVGEIRVTSVEWEQAPCYLAVVRDVTERHTVEQSLRDVVSTVSHEIRSPLSVVEGFVDVLMEDAPDWDPDEAAEYLERIRLQVQRMARLANDLLTVAKIDSGQVESSRSVVDVGEFLERASAEHAATGARLEHRADPGAEVWVDPDHLRRMIDNLIANAVKYGAPPVELDATVAGDDVVIRVRDHGAGVDPSFVPHLFDRFSRDSPDTGDGSSGLGLPIVLGLARSAGGDVWYEDDENGAVFALCLPRLTSNDR